MKRPKVGIVCPYDYFRFGGVQEHVRAVYEELKRRDYDVRVIAPKTAASRENTNPDVITIGTATKINSPLGTTSEVAYSAAPSELTELLEFEEFDVLHFHEPWVPVLSRQLLSKSTSKNLGTFHAKLPENLLNKSLEKAWLPYGKRVMNFIDEITAVSYAAADFVSSATDRAIRIIPNGIELKDFDPKKTSVYSAYDDDVPTIFYIGRLEKRKGVDLLLKAYRRLLDDHPNVRLVIAGDGPKRKSLQAYVDKHALDQVEFLGFVSDKEKKQLLKTCDVFCSPAVYGESFGIVLLEAMAMGAPVVAGNNPGYASVMRDRGRISLVDPKSTLDFSYRLELMLFDTSIQREFKQWAKEYIKQFDYTLVTDQYEDAYQDLVSDEV